jgi:nitric oxide reductase NorQ protein
MTPTTVTAKRAPKKEDNTIDLNAVLPASMLPPIFRYPAEDPHYFVNEQTRGFFRGLELLSRDEPINAALRGPQGAGKTSLVEWFSSVSKRPLFVLDIPTLREPKDLVGYKDVEPTAENLLTIIMRLSGFAQAIEVPRALILLDELTRVHPQVANLLLPLLDHRREVYVDELGRTLKVAEGVIFVATANIGLQFTGTFQWDAALADRLTYQLDVTYLPKDVEAQMLVNKTGIDTAVAQRLSEIAELTRIRAADENDPLSHEISTRQLIATAKLVSKGMPANTALLFTVVPTYSTDGGSASHRANVLQIIQGKLGS